MPIVNRRAVSCHPRNASPFLAFIAIVAAALSACGGSASTTPGRTTGGTPGDSPSNGGDTSDDAGTPTGGADPSPSNGTTGDGSGTPPATTGSSTDPAAACAALASAVCQKLASCAPFGLGAVYGTEASCRDRRAIECLASVGAPGASATPARVASCASSFASTACTDVLSNHLTGACAVSPGARAAGAGCIDDAQCASTFCARAGDEACGVCSAAPREGDACVHSSCGQGLWCSKDAKCVRPAAGKAGDPCTEQQQCDTAHGVGCNSSAKKCIALELATAGGTCGADSLNATKFTICPAVGSCSSLMGGTCHPAAADGAACSNTTSGPTCLAPARCVASKCALPDGARCK